MTDITKCKFCGMPAKLYALDMEGCELDMDEYLVSECGECIDEDAQPFEEWLDENADSWLVICKCGWMYEASTREKAIEGWNKGMQI